MSAKTTVQQEYELNVLTDESKSKWDLMQVDTHLQASLLAGLIDNFTGASNFVCHKANPSCVTKTLVCRTKTQTHHLNLEALLEIQPLPDFGEATHVVVGVLYGMETYCVLTEERRENSEENLGQLIANWKNSLSNNQDVVQFMKKFDQEDKQCFNLCRLYTDLQTAAVRDCCVFYAYQQCLDQIRNSIEIPSKSVPISVLLFPLKAITSPKKTIKFLDVDVHRVSRCCLVLDKLEKIRTRADAFHSDVKKKNPSLENRLFKFIDALEKYQEILKSNLKKSVVNSRVSSSEDELERVVTIAENHLLFKPCKLKRWLFYEEAEWEMVKKIMANLDGVSLVLAGRKEFESSLSSNKRDAVVLCIPPINEWTYEMLDVVENYVKEESLCNSVDFSEIDTGRIAADHGFDDLDDSADEEEDEREGIPFCTVLLKKAIVEAKIWQLMEVFNRQKRIANQPVQFLVVMGDARQSLLRDKWSNVKKSDCCFLLFHSQLDVDGTRTWNFKRFLKQLGGPPSDLKIQEATKEIPYQIIKWNYEHIIEPCTFTVAYRNKETAVASWKEIKTAIPGVNQVKFQLKNPGNCIQFSVAADTRFGRTHFSPVVDTSVCKVSKCPPKGLKPSKYTASELESCIDVGLWKMEELRAIKRNITETDGQFQVNVVKSTKVSTPTEVFASNGARCDLTFLKSSRIRNTSLFLNHYENGVVSICRVCPGKCLLPHSKKLRFECVQETQTTTMEEVKQKYEVKLNKKLTLAELVAEVDKEIAANERTVFGLLKSVFKGKMVERMPTSLVEYLNQLVAAEKKEKWTGYQERVESYKRIRFMAFVEYWIAHYKLIHQLRHFLEK